MEPTNIRFGGGASATTLHPLVVLTLMVVITLIFVLRRKYVVLPWLMTVLLIPLGQVVVLGGVHFTVYRIAIIFGLARLIKDKFSKKAEFAGGFSNIDTAFTLFALFSFTAFALQYMETQAIIRGLGDLLDTLGGYFVLRFLLRDWSDVKRAIKVLAVIALVEAVCMTNEQLTHFNVFGLLGGFPTTVSIREGKARAMGSFEVYITAGVFGATLIPLFLSLCAEKKSRIFGFLGLFGATVMTITASSSTPLLAYVAGIAGLGFWRLRRNMRLFRWCLVLVLVTLHLVMKAPVWALIARVDLTGSSSGYHRYMLVNQCITHFSEWWLTGCKDYNNWGYDMWDLSNQFVAYAVTGGLATIGAFILTLSRCFGRLGTARRFVEGNRKQEWLIWYLCAALLAHVVSYFGIGYFDQMRVAWYALLAMIGVAVAEAIPSRIPKLQEELPSIQPADSAVSWSITAANERSLPTDMLRSNTTLSAP